MREPRRDLATRLGKALRNDVDRGDGGHPDDGSFHRYLAHELGGAALDRFEQHLASCERCAQDLIAAARVESEATSSTVVPLRSDREDGARDAASPSHRARSSWWRVAAGVLVVLGAAVLARAGARFAAARLEPVLLSRLSEASGREISAGGLSFLVSSEPGVEVADLRWSDDPRFAKDDFFQVGSAVMRIEPGALLRGEVRGSVVLERPVLRLVQDASGLWNVETIGNPEKDDSRVPSRLDEVEQELERARRGGASQEKAHRSRVELASASIQNGILEITGGSPGSERLTLRGVDASYRSRPGTPASLAIEGRVGQEKHRVVVRGEIGPFDGDAPPRYRLDDVAFEAVPVRAIPGAPETLDGELSFDGHLDSTGRALDSIIRAAQGAGDLEVCCGNLQGRNLAGDVLASLAKGPREAQSEALRAATRKHAALSAALDAPDTSFARIAGHVELGPGRLAFEGLAFETSLLAADSSGTLSLDGRLDAAGLVRLSPELSGAVLAAMPEIRTLVASDGSLHLPYRASGSWPSVTVKLDTERVVAGLSHGTRFGFQGDWLAFGKIASLWTGLTRG